jgi:iron complex outermembrane recepter protein
MGLDEGEQKMSQAKQAVRAGVSVIALSLGTVGLTAPVHADESSPAAPPGAAPSSDVLAEVTVTARRRDESLERVPVAITAFGPQELAKRTITSETDLQAATPGLLIRSSTNSSDLNYVIRGQSLESMSYSSPAVLPYLNDVQFSTAGNAALYDLGSVQVLKGPQGTLFGRNTTGGAVLFNTVKPTDDLSGFLTVRGGNLSMAEATGAINLPIMPDTILLRVAGDFRTRDGYVLNLFDNRMEGDNRRHSVRTTLVVKPTSTIENTTVVQYDEISGTSVPGQLISVNAPGSTGPNGVPLASSAAATYNPATFNALFGPGAWNAFLAAHPGTPNMSYLQYLNFDNANGKFVADNDQPLTNLNRDTLVTNTTSAQINDNLSFKNILGYGKIHHFYALDYDGTPFPVITNIPYPSGQCPAGFNGACPTGESQDLKQISDEFQVSGTAFGILKQIAGFYYNENRTDTLNVIGFFDLSPFAPPVAASAIYASVAKDYAFYAQDNLDLARFTGVQGLNLTGGFRWTRETIDYTVSPLSTTYGPAEPRELVSKPSWTISLDYQVDPSLMLYVANRGSWRSGGFNASAPTVPGTAENGGNQFLPETTVDVEGGAKFRGNVGGVPLTANLAVYNQWVRDSQHVVYFFLGSQIVGDTVNVPEAQITGVELETNVRPVHWLELGSNVAYTAARFTQNTVNLFGTAVDYGPYGDTPRWAGSAYAQVQFPLDRAGEFSIRGDVFGQTSFYISNTNSTTTPGTKLSGYPLANGRAELRNVAGSGVSIAFFAKNIFNRGYYTGGVSEGASIGSTMALVGEPRTYGAELNFEF